MRWSDGASQMTVYAAVQGRRLRVLHVLVKETQTSRLQTKRPVPKNWPKCLI